MDEKDIKILSDLIKTCNLTKTAQRLYTTQSALTKRIQNLEDELGAKLFVRTKRGLLMTPTLEKIAPYFANITSTLETIKNLAASEDGEIAGTLSLGISSNYGRYRLPEVLKEYMASYPKVDIHVTSHRSPLLYKYLLEKTISVAIIRGDYPWNEGDIVLSEEPNYVAVGRAHASTPLDQIPYIARETDIDYMTNLARWLNENNLRPSVGLTISDVPTVVTLVEKGIGWAVLPAICLEQFDGILHPIYFKDGSQFTRKTHILYRKEHMVLPQMRAFIDIAQRHETEYKFSQGNAEFNFSF